MTNSDRLQEIRERVQLTRETYPNNGTILLLGSDLDGLLQLVTEQQREIEVLKTERQVEEARSAAAFKVSEAHPVEFSRALMEEMRQRGLIPKGSVEDILISFVLDRPTAQFPSSKSGGDQ